MTTPIYLFDGHCVLCSRGVQWVLKHEKTPDMQFVAILSGEGRKLAKAHDINPETPESFLFISNARTYEKSDAVIALARHVGGIGKMALIGKILPRPLRDWFYGLVAKNRYKIFGRTEACYAPSPENRDRFVLT